MSVSYIKQETRFILWGKAAGRCQYEGCNKQLYLDSLSKAEFNTSYIAHIIADSVDGPRGDSNLSKKLCEDIDNLMLLCDEHHRLVDKKQVKEHPVERLQTMKRSHEERMERITDITKQKEAHVILYGANIGTHTAPVVYRDASLALAPDYFPAESKPYELSLINSSYQDKEDDFWSIEERNLEQKFNQKITPLKESSDVQNYCVFGIAPQPLLIKFGTLLYDLANVEVYSNQKEPKTWMWKEGLGEENYFKIIQPQKIKSKIALVFSLSATITNERIYATLGEDCSIWQVTIDTPNNDFMKFKNHLSEFRIKCRYIFDQIKQMHGQNAEICVFPAMLPATAIELGRIWYPKADLPLKIYDQNSSRGGFIETITIKHIL